MQSGSSLVMLLLILVYLLGSLIEVRLWDFGDAMTTSYNTLMIANATQLCTF